MVRMFHRITAFVTNMLGLNYLGSDFKKFVTSHIGMVLFTNFQGVFINTLLIRNTGGTESVMMYNMLNFIGTGSSMLLAVFFIKKFTTPTVARIGIFGYLTVCLLSLIFMNDIGFFMPLIALTQGTASGFYWITYGNALTDYCTNSSRDIALGFIGLVSGIITVVMPAISGVVIGQFAGFEGYYIMLSISAVIAVVTIVSTFRLPKKAIADHKTHYKIAFTSIWKNHYWKLALGSEGVRGLREGVFAFFLNALLFEIVKSEALIGFTTLLTGVATIVSFFIAGKIIRPNNRLKCLMISITTLVTLTLILYVQLSPLTIIMLAVINATCVTFIVNPAVSLFLNFVQHMPDSRVARSEYLAIREFILNSGRVLGIVFVMFMPKTPMSYVTSMVILTLSQYGVMLMSRITNRYAESLKIEE